MTAILDRSEMGTSLRALRSRRRGRRLRNLDVIDTMYRAYVVGLGIIAAFIGLAAVVGDGRLAPSTLMEVRRDGPAIVGAAVALLMALGARSGSHGGPLAFEAADVQHVMLAPIDRALIVRSAARKQARGVVVIGALTGGAAGVVAGPRLSSHETLAWFASGVAFGIVAASAAWGSALLASTRRLSQGTAFAIGGVLLGWSVIDVVAHTTTSPLTMLGDLALLPFVSRSIVGIGVGVVAIGAVVAVGLLGAGGLALEPVLHRSELVRALRFAATIQDLRAVITLRRQLTHEQSRPRPWFALRRIPPTGHATWRRDWHGVLRWPAARVGRVAVLTIMTGAASAAAIRGTTPLIAIAPFAAYVIALDLIEGFAQELDHPDRASDLPLRAGTLYIAHLTTPFAVAGGLAALGLGAGVLVAALVPAAPGVRPVPLIAALAVAVGVTVAAPAAAALTAYLGRPDRDLATVLIYPGLVVAQQIAPIVIVALAFIPLFVAREARPPTDPDSAAMLAAAPAIFVALGIRTFLRSRHNEIA